MADLHTRYLGLVEKAKATLPIPVLASLNGVSPTTNEAEARPTNTEQTPAP